MKKFFIFVIISIALNANSFAQTPETYYQDAYSQITSMLLGKTPLDFKQAVLITENAYFEHQINQKAFDDMIDLYTSICKSIIASGNIIYKGKDVERATAQCAVFTFMTDSIPVETEHGRVVIPPFEYNFDDFAAQNEWSNMFVSTLMETRKGNCHSLPFLYKMIMNNLGQDAYLSLAPNHLYIKTHNQHVGWYNIELTCGDFPSDAWLMSSGYIHIDALRNGIYMDTLSLQQSIALCLVDLAQGYQAKFGISDGKFILQCCETALHYFPDYINALLLQAETLTALYKQTGENSETLHAKINESYAHIYQLGYRKMPKSMYLNWMNSLGLQTSNYRAKSLLLNKDDF